MTPAEAELIKMAIAHAPEIIALLKNVKKSNDKKEKNTDVKPAIENSKKTPAKKEKKTAQPATDKKAEVSAEETVAKDKSFLDTVPDVVKQSVMLNVPNAVADLVAMPFYNSAAKNSILADALSAVRYPQTRFTEVNDNWLNNAQQLRAGKQRTKAVLPKQVGDFVTSTVHNATDDIKRAIREQDAREYYDKHPDLGNAWWEYKGKQETSAWKKGSAPNDVNYDETIGKKR